MKSKFRNYMNEFSSDYNNSISDAEQKVVDAISELVSLTSEIQNEAGKSVKLMNITSNFKKAQKVVTDNVKNLKKAANTL